MSRFRRSVSQQDKVKIAKCHTFSKYSGLHFTIVIVQQINKTIKDFIRLIKDESRCGKIFGLSNHFTLHIFPYEYGQFTAIVHSKEKNCTHFSSKKKESCTQGSSNVQFR